MYITSMYLYSTISRPPSSGIVQYCTLQVWICTVLFLYLQVLVLYSTVHYKYGSVQYYSCTSKFWYCTVLYSTNMYLIICTRTECTDRGKLCADRVKAPQPANENQTHTRDVGQNGGRWGQGCGRRGRRGQDHCKGSVLCACACRVCMLCVSVVCAVGRQV